MELLFKRQQTSGRAGRVNFKLWGKVELGEDEKAVVTRYRLDEAVMIAIVQPTLIRNALIVGAGAFLVIVFILTVVGAPAAFIISVVGGGGVAYWFFHEKRETIFVRDLLHGRNFTCNSVVELARKEAWLETVTAYLRQVMESAKNWDGTARISIEPLPKDEAREVILRGL